MRLIDADAIKLPKGFFEEVDNVPKFYEWLNTLPPIEPKKGKWVEDEYWDYKCSACGKGIDDEIYLFMPYCPNCGAKMDEVEDV